MEIRDLATGVREELVLKMSSTSKTRVLDPFAFVHYGTALQFVAMVVVVVVLGLLNMGKLGANISHDVA